jgi:uncharacterized surface protein with fasciclin (FAS1) repeats
MVGGFQQQLTPHYYFMEERNTWVWALSIIVVLVVIGGFVWWFNRTAAMQAGGNASTTAAGASGTSLSGTGVSATEPAPVQIVNKTDSSIAGILAGLTGDSTYTSLFDSTGVGATLGARGPYTVFVSTNAGFNLLPPGTLSSMTAAEEKRFVQYSIVSGKALDVNAVENGSVTTLSGDGISFHVGTTGLVQVNSSYALAAYKASNGIVYILNQPLLPPKK